MADHEFARYLQANKTDKDSTPPRDAPPLTPLTKGLNLTGTPLVRKEKRQSSTRYNVSKNCELTPLSTLNESKYTAAYARACMHAHPFKYVCACMCERIYTCNCDV